MTSAAKQLSLDFSNLFHDKTISDFEISIKNDDKTTFGPDSHFSVHLLEDLNYHLDKLGLEEEYFKSAKVRESIVAEKFYLLDFSSQFEEETKDLTDSMVVKIAMSSITDFNIESKNWSIPCHRSILKHRSEYFKAMFSEKFQQENCLILDEMEQFIMIEMINYLYCTKINFSIQNCVGLTFCSNMFSAKEIELQSTKYLINSLNLDIVFDALNLTEFLQSNKTELKQECLKYLIQHSYDDEEKFMEFYQKIENTEYKEEFKSIRLTLKNQKDLKNGPNEKLQYFF
eukprot:gene2037-1544_t